MSQELNKQRLIRRILRVNHAGEHGAIAIYTAQIAICQRVTPDLLEWLNETLSHERKHRERFLNAMPSRQAKPCRALIVWSFGGRLLGTLTSLFGRTGVMICTSAVERTVHRHLHEQIAFLDRSDAELAETVREILKDEDAHLAYADEHHDRHTLFAKFLSWIVSVATETLILISTRGDSLRLKSALAASA